MLLSLGVLQLLKKQVDNWADFADVKLELDLLNPGSLARSDVYCHNST